MNDSRSFLPKVYNFKNNIITQSYIKKNADVIKNQIATAGLRLAAVLNAAFGK